MSQLWLGVLAAARGRRRSFRRFGGGASFGGRGYACWRRGWRCRQRCALRRLSGNGWTRDLGGDGGQPQDEPSRSRCHDGPARTGSSLRRRSIRRVERARDDGRVAEGRATERHVARWRQRFTDDGRRASMRHVHSRRWRRGDGTQRDLLVAGRLRGPTGGWWGWGARTQDRNVLGLGGVSAAYDHRVAGRRLQAGARHETTARGDRVR